MFPTGFTHTAVLFGIRRRPRVLLGASGSVAAIKVTELAHLLTEFADVKLVLTSAARHFVQQSDLPFRAHGKVRGVLKFPMILLSHLATAFVLQTLFVGVLVPGLLQKNAQAVFCHTQQL